MDADDREKQDKTMPSDLDASYVQTTTGIFQNYNTEIITDDLVTSVVEAFDTYQQLALFSSPDKISLVISKDRVANAITEAISIANRIKVPILNVILDVDVSPFEKIKKEIDAHMAALKDVVH